MPRAKRRPKSRQTSTLAVPIDPGGVSVAASEAEPKRLTAVVGDLRVSGEDPSAQGGVGWTVQETLYRGRSMTFTHPVTVTPAGSDSSRVKVEEVSPS